MRVNAWLVAVMSVEFVAMIFVGLRVGALLDREKGLINRCEIDDYPDHHKNAKKRTHNPIPPVQFQNQKGTNGKTGQSTPEKVRDALPTLITLIVHKLRHSRRPKL